MVFFVILALLLHFFPLKFPLFHEGRTLNFCLQVTGVVTGKNKITFLLYIVTFSCFTTDLDFQSKTVVSQRKSMLGIHSSFIQFVFDSSAIQTGNLHSCSYKNKISLKNFLLKKKSNNIMRTQGSLYRSFESLCHLSNQITKVNLKG